MHTSKAGFSLLQLSIILTVGALMLAATLPGGAGDDAAKARITLERMQKIEAATQAFMVANQRRPYPSDLTAALTSSAYGKEAAPIAYLTAAETTHFTSAGLNKLHNYVLNSSTLTVNSGTNNGIYKNWLVAAANTSMSDTAPPLTWVQAITSSTTLTINNKGKANIPSGANTYFRNPVITGGVPTKALGLPDEYGIDGYGRRIMYMVDARVTTNYGCMTLQNNRQRGAVQLFNNAVSTTVTGAASSGGLIQLSVLDSTGFSVGDVVSVNGIAGTTEANGLWTVSAVQSSPAKITLATSTFTNAYTSGGVALGMSGAYDSVMWALLSYGKDGQGGIGAQGSAITTRLKTGNTDAATTINAFYNGTSTQSNSYITTGLVNKPATSTFDDIVWTNPGTKNTCGTGASVSSAKDFRIDGNGGGASVTSAVFGDVNGDGWQDMIFGVVNANEVRVIFGKKDGWPEFSSSTANTYATASPDGVSQLTITRGSTAANGSTITSFGTRVATGDLNGDGYDDIIIGGAPASATTDQAYAIVFGRATWATTSGSYAIGTTASSDITLTGMPTGVVSHVAVGDVNGDGYDDVALPVGIPANSAYANFDGVDDWVSIPHNAALDGGTNMSVSAWFKLAAGAASSQQGLVSYSNGATTGWALYISLAYTTPTASLGVAIGGSWYLASLPGSLFTTNQWNHLVGTYDSGASQLKIYLNGVLKTTSTVTGTIGSPTAGMKIGLGNMYNSSQWYKGGLRDVRVYNSTLTANNALYLYNGGGTDPGTGSLIASWRLDEGAGTTINDSSTGGNTGTATNVTVPTPFWVAATPAGFAQGLLYGKSSGWSSFSMDTSTLNGSTTSGVYFDVASPAVGTPDVSYGAASAAPAYRLAAICNVNGDAYQDIIVPAVDSTNGESVYVKLGNSQSNLLADSASGMIDLSDATKGGHRLYFGSNAAAGSPNYDIKGVACKDIDSDGKDDILIYLQQNSGTPPTEYIYVYLGSHTFSAGSSTNLDAPNYDVRYNLTNSAPTGVDATATPQIPRFNFADMNNDGKKDIIISRSSDQPYYSISGTSFSLNTDGSGTHDRSGSGMAYILFQPSDCYSSSCLDPTAPYAYPQAIDFFTYSLAGIRGIKIAGGIASDGMMVEDVADINKDGRDDLLLSSSVSPGGGYLLYGKKIWPGAYDLGCIRDRSGAHCPTQILNK